ncbi:MAG TPA: F0F1 ATP synthase subunit delta [Candidatus Paceibacterota bacterium]
MQAQEYAQALIAATEGKSEKEGTILLERFFEVLKNRGHFKLLPSILRAYTLLISKEERDATLTLRVNKSLQASERKKIIGEFVATPAEDILVQERVDDTLASGFVLETKNKRIDRSAKRALLSLYQNIVSESV